MLDKQRVIPKRRYIGGFDGIRAIAVLGVIFYHLMPYRFFGGFLGVPIFFVLSGYLITDLLLQEFERNQKISLKKFYLKRIKRLYPALLTMLFFVTAWMTLFDRGSMANIRGVFTSSILYVNNWWQIVHHQSYFSSFGNASPFTHLWSLSIEGQFYLVWPVVTVFMIYYIRDKRTIFNWFLAFSFVSAILMAALFVPGQDPSRVYYGTDTRLFSILLGAALAFICPSNRFKMNITKSSRYALNLLGTFALIGIFVMFFKVKDNSIFSFNGGMLLFTFLSMILVGVTAHPASFYAKALDNKVFSWIGKRSYGIYLWQFPVMVLYENKIPNTSNHLILHLLIEFILILVISDLSYRYIEHPIQKMSLAGFKEHFRQFIAGKNTKIKFVKIIMTTLLAVIVLVGLIQAPNDKVVAQEPLEKELSKNKQKIERQKAKIIAKQNDEAKSNETSVKDTEQPVKKIDGLTKSEVLKAQGLNISAVGDSVLLNVSNQFMNIFPKMVIDSKIGRQLYDSKAIFNQLKDQQLIGDAVLIDLGSNGAFSESQFDEIMETIGKDKKVFVVNIRVPKNWQNTVNQLLQKMSTKYPNMVLIDWYNYSNQHEDWFYSDGVHMNQTGGQAFSIFVAKKILAGI